MLGAGIAGARPVLTNGSVDGGKTVLLTRESRGAIFWVHVFGAREGDVESFRLTGPDGTVLAERRLRIARNYAQWLAYVGKRRSGESWAPGIYRGEYRLYRGPQEGEVLAITREATVGP
jgi:hypothetical protein